MVSVGILRNNSLEFLKLTRKSHPAESPDLFCIKYLFSYSFNTWMNTYSFNTFNLFYVFTKISNNLIVFPQNVSLQRFKVISPVILSNFDLEFHA